MLLKKMQSENRFAVILVTRPGSLLLSGDSISEFESIEHHDFVPCIHEVFGELLFAIF